MWRSEGSIAPPSGATGSTLTYPKKDRNSDSRFSLIFTEISPPVEFIKTPLPAIVTEGETASFCVRYRGDAVISWEINGKIIKTAPYLSDNTSKYLVSRCFNGISTFFYYLIKCFEIFKITKLRRKCP